MNGRCQRAQAIKRRRQIWDALHPDNQRFDSVWDALEPGGKTLSTRSEGGKFAAGNDGGGKGFAASTAAAAGMTKQAINQHLARAEALGDDLERIKGKDQPATLPLDPLAARHY